MFPLRFAVLAADGVSPDALSRLPESGGGILPSAVPGASRPEASVPWRGSPNRRPPPAFLIFLFLVIAMPVRIC